MVEYKLFYTKQAQKDAKKLSRSNLKKKAEELLEILKRDPFGKPPEYEVLVGDLKGSYSRRINIQHRIVYQVYEKEKVVKVIRMWTHYEEWELNKAGYDNSATAPPSSPPKFDENGIRENNSISVD